METYKRLFEKLVPCLLEIFHDPDIRIILYGSVARGTQTAESDVDIAVITQLHSEGMYRKMIEAVVDLELEFNMVLSVHLIDAKKFSEWEDVMPFYRNVKREGIVLWPAA